MILLQQYYTCNEHKFNDTDTSLSSASESKKSAIFWTTSYPSK